LGENHIGQINSQEDKGEMPTDSGEDSGNSGNSNSDYDDGSDNEERENELPEDVQIIAQLPLPEAKQAAKQLIEKSLKENSISEQELDKEN